MKKSYLIAAILISMFCATAATAAAQVIKAPVKVCFMQNQFFRFKNSPAYSHTQFAAYITAQNFNVTTTLSDFTVFPAGPSAMSPIYMNVFQKNQAILTGAANFVEAEESIKTLCAVTFSCSCVKDKCVNEVTAAGVGCSIDGSGTLKDPFVFELTN